MVRGYNLGHALSIFKGVVNQSLHRGFVESAGPHRLLTHVSKEASCRPHWFSTRSRHSLVDILTDLTLPHAWYPYARAIERNVIIHVGPTNSGKTHSAVQCLQQAPSGIYCGPLRLLAWEMAERMNATGVPCSLVTGQERREAEGARHTSMTVEMADITKPYDCAVIDEIQMIASKDRGFAFTRALLGLAAKEVHVCGDPAAADLVKAMLEHTKDTVEVRRYERLSPLEPLYKPLGSYSQVRSGDCVVAFSRRDIYSIKREIEAKGKHKCCVVYGSLPPETRSNQAVQFNDANSGYGVMVASDAVGMGLNLNIRRVVFSTLEKFDGEGMRPLTVTEVKQIAGRSGRFGSQYPNGEVTCLDKDDLPRLHSCLASPTAPLEAAGLFPSFDQLALFSSQRSDLTFGQILEEFTTTAQLSPMYFMSNHDDMLEVAYLLDKLPLSLKDRYIFSISPVDVDDKTVVGALLQFAQEYAGRGRVCLERALTPATMRVPRTSNALVDLESMHKVFDLYLWLSFRMEDAFVDRDIALTQKELCKLLIEEGLKQLSEKEMPLRHKKEQRRLLKDLARTAQDDTDWEVDEDATALDPDIAAIARKVAEKAARRLERRERRKEKGRGRPEESHLWDPL